MFKSRPSQKFCQKFESLTVPIIFTEYFTYSILDISNSPPHSHSLSKFLDVYFCNFRFRNPQPQFWNFIFFTISDNIMPFLEMWGNIARFALTTLTASMWLQTPKKGKRGEKNSNNNCFIFVGLANLLEHTLLVFFCFFVSAFYITLSVALTMMLLL